MTDYGICGMFFFLVCADFSVCNATSCFVQLIKIETGLTRFFLKKNLQFSLNKKKIYLNKKKQLFSGNNPENTWFSQIAGKKEFLLVIFV